ncbi:MAG: hypothetical protein ACC635_00985 [Acidiferrobacterales bacterium]
MHAEVPYLETHMEVAAALYRQRKLWQKQAEVGSHSMANLEHRQRVHVHVLSHITDPDEAVPEKEHEIYVYLARRLQSDDQDTQNIAYDLAREFLAGNSVQQQASYLALLDYPQSSNEDLVKLFNTNEEVRPVLFNLWRDQSVVIDPAIVNAAVNHTNPEIASAALRYAAGKKEFGMDIFRNSLASLSSVQEEFSTEADRLVPGLWGALLRGDADINRKIRMAIEKNASENNEEIIRLAALSGDEELYQFVEAWAVSHPNPGLHLLALTGRKQAAKFLLEYLESGREAELASRSWAWLTGQNLSMVPRMQLVGDDKTVPESAAEVPLVPDYSQAATWWHQHKDIWLDEIRKISGEVFSEYYLLKRARQLCGLNGQDLRELLALSCGEPLSISSNAWIINQEIIFNELSSQIQGQSETSREISHA